MILRAIGLDVILRAHLRTPLENQDSEIPWSGVVVIRRVSHDISIRVPSYGISHPVTSDSIALKIGPLT